MIAFPHAKINLGLNITEKRKDGYHNLETIFYPIPLKDKLTIEKTKDGKKTTLKSTNTLSYTNPTDNLVYKAYQLLKKSYQLPEVNIVLEKNIPIGAGLGGGSADASFTIKMLNEMFSLHISDAEMESFVSQLGADCPFFIKSKPQFATGIGNIFTPIDLSLEEYWLILIKPNIHISTADAYSLVVPQKSKYSLIESSKKDIGEWRELIKNDFEKSVFVKYPQIEEIKNTLYSNRALYASMSGSGSSVFGIFEEKVNLQHLFSEHQYFSFKL